MKRDAAYWSGLVRELASLPRETGWLEFKHNKADPQEIGENISALANSAALEGKAQAYIVWGVADDSHAVVGTTFDPAQVRRCNEELESWLLRSLAPKIEFRFQHVDVDGVRVVVLVVARAMRTPVQFLGTDYVRIGSYTKRIKDFPEHERSLWRVLDATPFESQAAAERLPADDALALLDYPTYFQLLGRPLPNGRDAILVALQEDHLVRREDGGAWTVCNLGALLFARKLADFTHLKRKAVRVIAYQGASRITTLREQEGGRGYASGFEGLIGFVNGLLPSNEVIGQAFAA